jgi:hypothetical protein
LVRGGEPPPREALISAATWFLSLLKKPMILVCKLWNGGVGFVCLDSVEFGMVVSIFDVFARALLSWCLVHLVAFCEVKIFGGRHLKYLFFTFMSLTFKMKH